MHKIMVFISKILWKICGISPKMGNMVMDIISYDRYVKIMKLQHE